VPLPSSLNGRNRILSAKSSQTKKKVSIQRMERACLGRDCKCLSSGIGDEFLKVCGHSQNNYAINHNCAPVEEQTKTVLALLLFEPL